MKKILLVLSFFLILNFSNAQNHPEDPQLKAQASTHWVLSADYMREKNYREAANSLHWLMTNVPNYFDGVYVNAYKAYEQLAAKETNKQQKAVYLDSMLTAYQLKKEIFDLSIREKNNLAFKYYKYFKNSPSKMKDAMAAYEEIYTAPNKVINNNVVAYMYMLVQYKKYGNEVTLDKAFEVHDQITQVIEMKEAAGVDAKKLKTYKDVVDGLFNKLISGDGDIDCNTIEEKFGPIYDENPSLNWAKRVFTLILDNKCTESPYFIRTAVDIWKEEQGPGMAIVIAQNHAKVEDYPLAIEWYENAISVSESDAKKASLYMNIANIYGVDGQKAKAREAALKAAGLDVEIAKEAYTFVGNLYMGSFDDCKKEASQVDDRAVFILAYEMFEKAGNQKGMESAKEQFPTVSQAFDLNLKDGAPLNVGCWIQTKTTLRTRKSN